MTKLYFDNPQGIILLDGVICKGSTANTNTCFCIEYVPFDDNYSPIICAVNGKGKMRDDVLFIRHGKNYIVRFCPQKRHYTTSDEVYIQKVLEPNGATSHCLTCHKNESCKISIETKDEFITIDIPCKVSDTKFSCTQISGGQLLSVFSKLENGKTHIAILHYNGDYNLLLDICCDEVFVEEDGLRVCDFLHDTLNRKCIRKLSFSGDCFAEQSRHFENSCCHSYIDEVIPYTLVESICYGDYDCTLNCLSTTMRGYNIKELFGDFVGICDCLDYNPFELTLLYSDCNGLYTKTFRFDVTQGKINKIYLT